MTDIPRLRPDLHGVPAYRAGARVRHATLPSYSLASNEVPYGPLPGVAEAVRERLPHLCRYPDPAASELSNALADRLGVGVDELTLGTGSVAVCQQVVMAACSPGDEVVYAWRSFEAYPIVTRLVSAQSIQVPLLPDARHDLAAMAAAVSDRTRVVFVCTPNNPTGPAVTHDELVEFLDRIPRDVLVVVDEAYFEFGLADDGHEALDGVALSRGRPNVMVLRTFSKAYGLAGLRVGYGVASPVVAAAMRKTAIPFGVSALAQVAAIASLDQQDELRKRVTRVRIERDRVVDRVRQLGYDVPDTGANFYWVPLGHATEAFAHACRDSGVTVRAFADEGVRITVGEPDANDIVLRLLADWT
ncbi:MAG: histidinol-phosphate transaminase [Candidatus Nanopelagicales bacterium]